MVLSYFKNTNTLKFNCQIFISQAIISIIDYIEEERVQTEIDRNKPLFLSDCQRYGDYTKQECEKIWNERSDPPKPD